MENPATSDIIFYANPQGNTRIEVIYEGETFWLSQKRMAELLGVDVHLKSSTETQAYDREATIRNFRMVQFGGTKCGNQGSN